MTHLPPEPPLADDDTQPYTPYEPPRPFAGAAPTLLADAELRLRDAWAALGQLDLNGFYVRILDDVAATYKQVVAERLLRDSLTDDRVDFLPLD